MSLQAQPVIDPYRANAKPHLEGGVVHFFIVHFPSQEWMYARTIYHDDVVGTSWRPGCWSTIYDFFLPAEAKVSQA